MSVEGLRTTIAQSSEAVADLNGLFAATLGRAADPAGIAYAQSLLIANGSLGSVRNSLANSVEGQALIGTVYQQILNRPVDSAGLAAWTTQLATGAATVSGLRTSLATSAEAQALLGRLYQQIVGRPADSAGLAYFTSMMAGGTATVGTIRAALASSAEGQAAINASYLAVLHRAADPTGLAYFTARFSSGQSTLADLRAVLATSAEAAQDDDVLTSRAYTEQAVTDPSAAGSAITPSDLDAIYEAVLGRPIDSAGQACWLQQAMNDGLTTDDIWQAVANSAEAASAITSIYTSILGRAPEAGAVAFWQSGLAGGGTLAGVRSAVAGSPEAASAIDAIYVAGLDRPAEPLGRTLWQLAMANETDTLQDVRVGVDTSSEAHADIATAISAGQGTGASAVQVAAGESELLSGITLTQFRSLASAISSGTATTSATVTLDAIAATIVPLTETSSNPTPFIYGLPNNDILLAAGTRGVTVASGTMTISDFDVAADILRLPSSQYGSFSALSARVTSVPAGSKIDLGGAGNITLVGVTPSQLLARDFTFA